MAGSSGGGKSRKAGRNAARCQRYRNDARQEVNTVIRALRRRRTHPKDRYVADVLSRLASYVAQAEREMKAAFKAGAGPRRTINAAAVLAGSRTYMVDDTV